LNVGETQLPHLKWILCFIDANVQLPTTTTFIYWHHEVQS